MKDKINKFSSGFTVMEMLIAVAIIAALTMLAYPKVIRFIEYSKSTEAFAQIGAIRRAMGRCQLVRGAFTQCHLGNLDMDDPNTEAYAHFTYSMEEITKDGYRITATRNSRNDGDGMSTVVVIQSSTGVQKSGTGVFEGIE